MMNERAGRCKPLGYRTVPTGLDSQQAVVLGEPLRPRDRTDFDVARSAGNGEIRQKLSSVSPERAETTAENPTAAARSITRSVSLRVPI